MEQHVRSRPRGRDAAHRQAAQARGRGQRRVRSVPPDVFRRRRFVRLFMGFGSRIRWYRNRNTLKRIINFKKKSLSGVILIKRAGDGARNIKGCWDSIHVIEVQEKSTGRSAHYKLTSTVMLWLQTSRPGSGTMNLGGSLTRQVRTQRIKTTNKLQRFVILCC